MPPTDQSTSFFCLFVCLFFERVNLRQCNNLILRTCDQSWNVDFANTTWSARIIINMIVGMQGKEKKKRNAETIHCKCSCSRQNVFGRQSFSKLETIPMTVQKLLHSQPIKQRRRWKLPRSHFSCHFGARCLWDSWQLEVWSSRWQKQSQKGDLLLDLDLDGYVDLGHVLA